MVGSALYFVGEVPYPLGHSKLMSYVWQIGLSGFCEHDGHWSRQTHPSDTHLAAHQVLKVREIVLTTLESMGCSRSIGPSYGQ